MKLSPRFFGHFQVLERAGEVSYKLYLPTASNFHLVFHVSLLKKSQGVSPLATLPSVDCQGEILPKPEVILGRRSWQHGDRAITDVLVKWQGAIDSEATW